MNENRLEIKPGRTYRTRGKTLVTVMGKTTSDRQKTGYYWIGKTDCGKVLTWAPGGWYLRTKEPDDLDLKGNWNG